MNDGKTPRPKPKWWSRPHLGPAGQPPVEDPPAVTDQPTTPGPEQAPAPPTGPAPTAPPPADPSADFELAKAAAPVAPARPADTRHGDTERPAEAAPTAAEPAVAASGDAVRPVDAEPNAAGPAAAASSDAVRAADAGPDGVESGGVESGGVEPAAAVPGAAVPGAVSAKGVAGSAPSSDSAVTDGVEAAEARSDGAVEDGEAASAGRRTPRHAPDPYSTPPYGEPGPWAPAPPVQHPVPTPAHGTHVPPHQGHPPHPGTTPAHGTTMPAAPAPGQPVPGPQPYPAHQQHQQPGTPTFAAPAPAGPGAPTEAPAGVQWQHYDPWRASAAGVGQPGPGPSRAGRKRGPLVVGALLLALLAGGVGGGIGVYLERRTDDTEQIHLPQSPAETKQARDPDSIAGIAARALPSVVTIHVKGAGAQGTGTGFVLDESGNILTNNHVVESADQGGSDAAISVTFNGGQSARAKIVGRDAGYDLAVIRVRGVTGLKPLALGNSDSVRVGDPVVAIGAPYDLAGTVTSGIISAKERPITAGGDKVDGSDVSYVDALQTDAPINPGNSGGPLVDAKGRVIGINSVIRAADDGGLGTGQGGSIGLGFAIPINQGKRVAEELINTGKAVHPVIGVTLDMKYRGDGARVADSGGDGPAVTEGGPGDKAGVRSGDVITKVDGVPVRSGQELIVKIRSHRPGDRLRLTLERGADERVVELALGAASDVPR
ncbi:S1C family serine protease [Streptomyces sp. NPDC057702]|uniref:S1C family serine protease n=1 Tax=unclassified Streptomyces TaxID=2593676 RepID=UPI003687B36F